MIFVVIFSVWYIRMGQPVRPIGPSRPHANDGLGGPMASEIGPEAIGPSPRSSLGQSIPILTRTQIRVVLEEMRGWQQNSHTRGSPANVRTSPVARATGS